MFTIDTHKSIITLTDTVIHFDNILNAINVSIDDVVYIGGSLVEGAINPFSKGMGTPKSDIDVFIIRNPHDFKPLSEDEFADSTSRIYSIYLHDQDLDVTEYNKSAVYALADALNKLEIDAFSKKRMPIQERLNIGNGYTSVVSFLNRLNSSLCIYNHEIYNEVKALIDYGKFMLFEKDRLYKKHKDLESDVLGHLMVAQAEMALYSFRKLVQNLMHLAILNEKMLVDRGRWILLKFNNIVELTGRYLELHQIYTTTFREDLTDDALCIETIKNSMTIAEQELSKLHLQTE